MKTNYSIIVVGNKFKQFAQHSPVMTFEEITNFIEQKKYTFQYYTLHIGQGLQEEQINEIKQLVSQKNHAPFFTLDLYRDDRSNKILTHKHLIKNILISNPKQISEKKYEMALMIDENCAELSDHITGEHLQGMLLIEAARQATLAVTEKYFITEEKRKSVGFVTNSLETKFLSFSFPIETKIVYEIIQNRGILDTNRSFKVNVQFIQNQQVTTEIVYGFSLFEKDFLHEKEQSAAQIAIENLIYTQESYYAAA